MSDSSPTRNALPTFIGRNLTRTNCCAKIAARFSRPRRSCRIRPGQWEALNAPNGLGFVMPVRTALFPTVGNPMVSPALTHPTACNPAHDRDRDSPMSIRAPKQSRPARAAESSRRVPAAVRYRCRWATRRQTQSSVPVTTALAAMHKPRNSALLRSFHSILLLLMSFGLYKATKLIA